MTQIEPWLTLKSIQGIGNLLFMRLIDHFGSPEKVFAADLNRLQQVPGVSKRIVFEIREKRYTSDWVKKEIEQAAQKGYQIISLHDACYPDLLRHIPDPPPVLYLYGQLESMTFPIAVVGSRRATNYGHTAARRLCAELAHIGATIISGMARGIDTAAHIGAIEGEGRTVAVLGSGLNWIYPKENLKLFHKIAENGCVISEFALDTAPEAFRFPMRNRIISGIAMGTIVVEAARKSGSLITARLAAEQNREVFAVPGNIDAATTKGTHDLIKQGAKLVENANDVLEEIAPQLISREPAAIKFKALPELSDEERNVFAKIDAYPIHIDTLARLVLADNNTDKTDIGRLTGVLSQLELKGMIVQEPGKNFIRHHDFINK